MRVYNVNCCLTTILLLLLLVLAPRATESLPEGFEDQSVVRLIGAVDVTFATDNDGNHIMFAIGKNGDVHSYTNFETDDESNTKQTLALNLSDRICTDGERGLGGILAHPNFASNRYIYLFYTKKNFFDVEKTNINTAAVAAEEENSGCVHSKEIGPRNTCSRFTVKDDLTIDEDSELVLFQTAPLDNKIHNGGGMHIGVDGMLYVTLGDAGERGLAYSQRLDILFGSILRMTDTGDIPDDNPFVGDGTERCNVNGQSSSPGIYCQEIFAYGLRNPFRFTMDPTSTDKVRFLINDVGGQEWEETNVGGEGYAGVNYGWPTLEGPCKFASETDCAVVDEFQDPLFWYRHNEEDQGAAVGVAIVPPELNWPAKFHSPNFFFVDFVWGYIYLAEEDQSNYCRDCIPPKAAYKYTEFHPWERPVGLQFGPYKNTQAMYYAAREGQVNIRRIVYRGAGNNAPSAVFTADKDQIRVNGTITFDASNTTDPDPDDILTYEWDFGDGSAKESGITARHKYMTGGTYIVKLLVHDSSNFTDDHEIEISVGYPPKVEIINPPEGTQFAVGDMFTIEGFGTDSEGNPLAAENLVWEVRQHHGGHYHPFFDGAGPTFTIGPAPGPEDFLAATNSYLELRLTAYDSSGLHSTVSRYVTPKTVYIDFETEPTGLTILLDEQPVVAPERILTWENHNLRIVAPDQGDYVFKSWTNGPEQSNIFNIPAKGAEIIKYIVQFEKISSPTSPTNPPTPIPTPILSSSPTPSPILSSSPTPAPISSSSTSSPVAAPVADESPNSNVENNEPSLSPVVVTADRPKTDTSSDDDEKNAIVLSKSSSAVLLYDEIITGIIAFLPFFLLIH